MHRVHAEATECVVFIVRQRNAWEPTVWVRTECVVVFIGRAWTEQAMETRPGVLHNGGNDLVFDRPRSNWDPIDREGPGVPQNGGNRPPTVETGVLLIGRGVAYRKTEETDLCERYDRNGGPVHREGCGIPQNGRNGPPTVETGVLLIGRGVAYHKTDETDLLRSKRGRSEEHTSELQSR